MATESGQTAPPTHDGERHHAPPDGSGATAAEIWDARYAGSDRVWSGNPNPALVRETADLPPGSALDLGCGEGADAVWLARQGWRVTAVDVSRVALDRAAAHAAEAGVAGRVDCRQHDLAESFPEGAFDLVSVQYLHSHGDLLLERILRTAAQAVTPGGVLLVTRHAGWPGVNAGAHPGGHASTPEEVLRSLELPDGPWQVLLSEEFDRPHAHPDGQPGTHRDNVLKIKRLPA